MHKIKEMLHSDDSVNTSSSSTTHHHGDGNTRYYDNNRDLERGHLNSREFQHDHARHGEIEHGRVYDNSGIHEHHHQHLHGNSGERHIYTDREVARGGDLYREGADPTLNRDVTSACRHDNGTSRARVAESKIVKEKIKEVELHKVQPVIHREREQREIRHVVEPQQQFEVKDTKVLHREKDIDLGVRREASTLETSRGIQAPRIEASREFIGTERQHQELPMRVEEHVHKSVEEHVHPVIYKETLRPKVMEETHHVYERVEEQPIETYEVRELRSRGHNHGLQDAERSFFNKEASRGININEGHLHERGTHLHERDRGLDRHDIKSRDYHRHGDDYGHRHHVHNHGNTTRVIETERPVVEHTHVHRGNMMQEPVVGHHQNIGAHHVAGAIPAGHNTAYDAALCNECTGNQVCSHGQRDAALMQKMNEKKIVKDQNMSKKEQKKLRKSGDNASADRLEHQHVHVV